MRRTRTLFLGTSLICAGLVLAGQRTFAQSKVGAVSGQVSGQVKDLCGRVIPGATVTLGNASRAPLRAYTDGEGRYVFHDIPSSGDPWALGVEIAGFEKERREEIRLKEAAPLEQNIRLSPDLSLKEVLTVSHGDPNARFQKYSAIGTVTDPNGIPVSGATVTFRPAGSAASILATDRCTTDELGRYYVSQWLSTSARWILSVEFQGLAPYVQSDIELQPNQTQVIKIGLRSDEQ
jgi:hypothetical protein